MSLFLSLLITLLCVAAALSQVTELQIETTFLPEKCEKKSAKGDKMSMHYTGKIDESSATGVKGKVFDSSVPRKKAFEFTLGVGQVIKGWDEGLLNMCPGEKRVLTIPPSMGYGAGGAGGAIPGGATLHFEVECLDFGLGSGEPEPPQSNIFLEIDADGNKKVTYDEIEAWFKSKGQNTVPTGLFEKEDANQDGWVSWDEFTGPKGSSENDEL